MDLIITSQPIDFDFPKNFYINKKVKSCNNLVLIFNDESEIKAPTIKYNKLFVINNIPNINNEQQILLEYEIKNKIPEYTFNNFTLFIHNRCHTWNNIFDVIGRELNKTNYIQEISFVAPIRSNIISNIIIIILILIIIFGYMYHINEMSIKNNEINNLIKRMHNINDNFENKKQQLEIDIIKLVHEKNNITDIYDILINEYKECIEKHIIISKEKYECENTNNKLEKEKYDSETKFDIIKKEYDILLNKYDNINKEKYECENKNNKLEKDIENILQKLLEDNLQTNSILIKIYDMLEWIKNLIIKNFKIDCYIITYYY